MLRLLQLLQPEAVAPVAARDAEDRRLLVIAVAVGVAAVAALRQLAEDCRLLVSPLAVAVAAVAVVAALRQRSQSAILTAP